MLDARRHGAGAAGTRPGKGFWPSLGAAALLAACSAVALADDAPKQAPHAPVAKKLVLAKRPLDLSAPPINHILTPEQVRALVADQDDQDDENGPPEDVMVEKAHIEQPIPGGLVSIPWALLHPLQAWRIFAPVTDD